MSLLFLLLIFIFGTAVGSFLGVVVDRINSKEPIWKGRSHCDHCRHKLHAGDLIPLLSFFLLQRKCRYCHKELSRFYPLIEACTGVAYVAAGYVVFQQYGYFVGQTIYQLLVLYYFALIGALLAIFFADLRYGIIPFKIVAFALGATILWDVLCRLLPITYHMQIFTEQPGIINILLSAIGAASFFFLLFALTRGRGMGFGDVVYAFLMGFTLGFPRVILGLYIAFVTGAVISLVLVALKKKKIKGGTIPFGPFLVFGTIVSLLWGNVLIQYLLRFLS